MYNFYIFKRFDKENKYFLGINLNWINEYNIICLYICIIIFKKMWENILYVILERLKVFWIFFLLLKI